MTNEAGLQFDEEKTPFYARRKKCQHTFIVAHLPMPIETFVKLAKKPCPMCGADAKDIYHTEQPKETHNA